MSSRGNRRADTHVPGRTGNDRNVAVASGPTGVDTIQRDPADCKADPRVRSPDEQT